MPPLSSNFFPTRKLFVLKACILDQIVLWVFSESTTKNVFPQRYYYYYYYGHILVNTHNWVKVNMDSLDMKAITYGVFVPFKPVWGPQWNKNLLDLLRNFEFYMIVVICHLTPTSWNLAPISWNLAWCQNLRWKIWSKECDTGIIPLLVVFFIICYSNA